MNSNSVLHIGKVESVRGRVIEIKVHKSKNASHLLFNGQIIKSVSVGSYLKICKGFQELIGKIDEEFITEDKLIRQKDYKQEKERIKRILRVSLIGYFEESSFKQGVKELPLLDNEAFLLTADEFSRVHNFIKDINGEPDIELNIGVLSNETGTSIGIGVNSLFASHIGIFGNTGSGKSYTLASLYHKLFKVYRDNSGFKKNAKFLLIDFNGEYSKENAIIKSKTIYKLNTNKELKDISDNHNLPIKEKLPINEKIIINYEVLSILSNATEKTQRPYIKRVVELYDKISKSVTPLEYFKNSIKKIIVDVLKMANKQKAYNLIEHIESIVNHDKSLGAIIKLRDDVDFQNTYDYFKKEDQKAPITEEEIKKTNLYKAFESYNFPVLFIDKLLHFFKLRLIYDLFEDRSQYEHIGPAVNKLESKSKDLQKVIDFNSSNDLIPVNEPLCIIDLNNCNIDIKKLIPLLVSKHIYETHKKSNKEKDKFLNIIIDEAHNILSYDSKRESETWKDYRLETFEEIIKEGRKFGVFLTIASQRPSDISDTIISQLHNYFLHRLINNRDIQAVERTISYLDKVSFEALPILPTGSCVLAGLSAQVPVIINIAPIIPKENEPYNKTIRPTDFWDNEKSKEETKEEDVEQVEDENNVIEEDDLPF